MEEEEGFPGSFKHDDHVYLLLKGQHAFVCVCVCVPFVRRVCVGSLETGMMSGL